MTKSRREQNTAATRTALLAAATRRFAEQGFTSTALADIAVDIHTSRGAIYHHFATKTALFSAVFEQLETEAVRLSAAAAAQAGNPWDAVFGALDVLLDQCCDPVYGKLVWIEAPIALGRRAEEQFVHGLVEQLITALIDDGRIEHQPPATTTRIVFSMLRAAGLALAETAEQDKPRLKAEYRKIIGLMVTSLRVEPEHA